MFSLIPYWKSGVLRIDPGSAMAKMSGRWPQKSGNIRLTPEEKSGYIRKVAENLSKQIKKIRAE